MWPNPHHQCIIIYIRDNTHMNVHENCPVFKTPHPPCPSTSKIFPPLWTPPLQMITSQLKENNSRMTNICYQIYSSGWLSFSVQKQSPGRVCKKGVLRNFAKFTGKYLRQSLFFNKVADLTPAALLNKSLWHRFFPVNFAKFLRTPFLQNTSARLLLWVSTH